MTKRNPIDTTPKARVVIERIGGSDWQLEEAQLDVFDDVTLWDENPRLQPFLSASSVASEGDLEAALQRTRGYDNLRKSIEQIGQMEPIYVWRKDETAKYLVFEGATRVAILRELARKRAQGPEAGRFTRIKVKILPPDFGETERVVLLAKIHVRGSGVRAWGRYIEAKFIHDHVTGQGAQRPLMSMTDMAKHMEKSLSWVQRLRDAYEFGRHFVEAIDSDDAQQIAVDQFSTLEEISKAAIIGPKLRDYGNTEFDQLRTDVFQMVRNDAFSEYRDARFMKDFYEDPEKWALLKSGEKGIAKRLASELKTSSGTLKAKIAGLEQHIQRVIDRGGDHGLAEEDAEALRRAQTLIQQQVHDGIRPFRIGLRNITTILSEASLSDVKSLEPSEIAFFTEAVDYFNGLLSKHKPAAA